MDPILVYGAPALADRLTGQLGEGQVITGTDLISVLKTGSYPEGRRLAGVVYVGDGTGPAGFDLPAWIRLAATTLGPVLVDTPNPAITMLDEVTIRYPNEDWDTAMNRAGIILPPQVQVPAPTMPVGEPTIPADTNPTIPPLPETWGGTPTTPTTNPQPTHNQPATPPLPETWGGTPTTNPQPTHNQPATPPLPENWNNTTPYQPPTKTPDTIPDTTPTPTQKTPPTPTPPENTTPIDTPAKKLPNYSDQNTPIIIIFGAKGGIGKTSTSINLAWRAATTHPNMRVCLIDCNRGQSDIRTRLRTLNLPTLFNTIPDQGYGAINTPDQNNQDRPKNLPPIPFATILAPPSDQSNPQIVTDQIYLNAIHEARANSDLLIIDTQISENYDTTTLFDNVLLPYLAYSKNVYAIGATEDSTESINNLTERLRQYTAKGTPPGRIYTLITIAHAPLTPQNLTLYNQTFNTYSTFTGAIPYDPTIYQQIRHGQNTENHPQIAPILDRILQQTLGTPPQQ